MDNNIVKEYFPVSAVVPAILDIYQQLLGVRFEEMKGSTWHPGKFLSRRDMGYIDPASILFRRHAICCMGEGCQS
jgi:hypothetical protein